LVLCSLYILIDKLYLFNLCPVTSTESSVAIPAGKVKEFDVVCKVVTLKLSKEGICIAILLSLAPHKALGCGTC